MIPAHKVKISENLKTPGWRPRTTPYSLCSPKEIKQRKSTKTQSGKSRVFEIRLWIVALVLCNLGLFKGIPATNLIFRPEAAARGEWWRLLTWPFVHVSPYHLLLDGSAFLMLYSGLNEPRGMTRISLLLGSAAGSLLLPLWLSPGLSATGLCGLSGIAHGLLGATALELATGKKKDASFKKAGILLLVGLLAKCAVEMATGQVFLASLHLGAIGSPVVATHAGGALGGLAAFYLLRLGRHRAA